MRNRRASLLIIFLFCTGIFAIIITGLYFMVTGGAVEQSFVEQAGKNRVVEEAFEQIHRSELDRLLKQYIASGLSPSLMPNVNGIYNGSNLIAPGYQPILQAAEDWVFSDNTVVNWSNSSQVESANVTITNWPVLFPLSKSSSTNPIEAAPDNFLEHPLNFALGYCPSASLSASYAPTWNNQAFSYSHVFYLYKEAPVCFLPFSAAYQFANTTAGLDSLTLGGGPAVQFDGANAGASAKVAYDSSLISAAPTFANLVSTYGMTPQAISSYATTGTVLQYRQMYALDASATVLEFSGGALSSTPTGFSTASFDGKTRVVVNLNTVSAGKYYIHCTSALDMAAGVVLEDIGNSSTTSGVSIATDGMLYLWTNNTASYGSHYPLMAATSYGAVGLADANYSGSSASAALSWGYPACVSAYTKKYTWLSDTFNRTGSLASSNGTGFTSNDSGISSWGGGGGAGSLGTSATSGGQLTSTGGNGWCEISLGTGMQGTYAGANYGGGLLGFYVATSALTSGSNLDFILANTSSYVDSGANESDRMDYTVTSTSGGSVAYNSRLNGTDGYDSTTLSYSISAASNNVFGFFYAPGTNEIFITVNNVLALKKKLANPPSWFPDYVVLKMDPNVTVTNFSMVGTPLGTFLTTPQNTYSGAASATFYGALATGEGISASLAPLGTGSSLNFSYKSAVGQALENYCERVIVHYPYFH